MANSSHSPSRHMGSSPTAAPVVGVLGKHVQPFVPARSSVGWPPSSAGQSMMVAFFAISAGPALSAWAILASGVPGAAAGSSGIGAVAVVSTTTVSSPSAASSCWQPHESRAASPMTIGYARDMIPPRAIGSRQADDGATPRYKSLYDRPEGL